MKKITLMLLMVFALGLTTVMAQGRTVSGKVIDSGTKQPIAGATVMVEGTQNGAYSMEGGQFVISNVSGAVNLQVSFMGYTEAVVPVSATETNVEVSLKPSAFQMDEVVVVAYGKADKKSLTGSVAVVSSDEIAERPVTSVTSAIAGTSPGIQMTSASGAPGSSPTIRIRGIGSINSSNTPLYIVDGAQYTGNISSISPDDIASMTVLKDAASTALYGSKASNGVIMIETKGGRKDKVQFDVKISEGIMFRAQPEYDKLGAEDFYKMAWTGQRNAMYYHTDGKYDMESASAYATENLLSSQDYYNIYKDSSTGIQIADNQLITSDGAEFTSPVFNPNAVMMDGYKDDLDWLDQVAGVGFRQNYNISASGGTDKASYFGSIGYTDEDSYFEYTSFTRLNARMKADFQPTKWLKFGLNVSPSLTESNNPYSDGSTGYANPWYMARVMPPIYPFHAHDDATGEYILVDGAPIYDDGYETEYSNGMSKRTRGMTPGRHPIYEGSLNIDESEILQLFGQTYATISFLKDFKFTVDASMTNRYYFNKSYDNGTIGDGYPSARMNQTSSRRSDYTFKQMLEWDRSFGDHNVNVLLGHENFQSKYNNLYASKSTEQISGIIELNNFVTMVDISGYESMYRTEGYFARANYNYKSKYYFSASFRRDGASKFNPANQWGNFWSVGASWIVSDEDFMSNAMWVDFLKLRASYGTNGNDGGVNDYYIWMPLYSLEAYNNASSLVYSSSGALDLTWESANSLDLGVDFRFWNKLNGSVGFFDKTSDDLIFSVPVPYALGYTSVKQNVGSMYNRGIEVALDVDAIRSRDWVWNIGFNATWYKNRITSLPEANAEDGIISGTKKLMEGHSIYDYWLKQFAYVDPQDGASVYLFDDVSKSDDGTPIYEWDPSNDSNQFEKDGEKYTKASGEAIYDWSGSAIPALNGSITSRLSWKNLSLDLMFTYKLGGKAMDSSYNNLLYSDFNNAMSPELLNSWTQPGQITDTPRFDPTGSSNLNTQSNRHLIDASYIALQNVTLNYSFPKKIANKLSLSALSVYASGENLFQISAVKGYDAASNINGTTDNSRFGSVAVVTFGVNVSF